MCVCECPFYVLFGVWGFCGCPQKVWGCLSEAQLQSNPYTGTCTQAQHTLIQKQRDGICVADIGARCLFVTFLTISNPFLPLPPTLPLPVRPGWPFSVLPLLYFWLLMYRKLIIKGSLSRRCDNCACMGMRCFILYFVFYLFAHLCYLHVAFLGPLSFAHLTPFFIKSKGVWFLGRK